MKVAIIYYSTYGHIVTMAEAVKAGLDKSGKPLVVNIFQVPETLLKDVLKKMHAPPKASYPVATIETLKDYDAFVFGYPTRFGTLPAQLIDFLGASGLLWASGGLYGKPVSLFSSVSSPGGSQEMVFRNFFSYIAHHGMIYVPLGYAKAFAEITNMEEVHGGTPYGAVCFAGTDGSRQPSNLEKKIAFIQGESFGESAILFVNTAKETESKREKETDTETKTENVPELEKAPETPVSKRVQQRAPSAQKEKNSCGVQCLIV